jgi:hypothetical protein
VAQSYSVIGTNSGRNLAETSLYEADLAPSTLPHGHRQVQTCRMEICEFTAVALTVAPLSPRLA